jgi:hypothetical protein
MLCSINTSNNNKNIIYWHIFLSSFSIFEIYMSVIIILCSSCISPVRSIDYMFAFLWNVWVLLCNVNRFA